MARLESDPATGSPRTTSKTEVYQIDNANETQYDIQYEEKEKSLDISKEAVGGTFHDLPPGYYRSKNFIGTVAALCFGSISVYLGYVLPVNSLAYINADIGPSKQYTWIPLVQTLSQVVAFVLVGRLSDIFGRRWFYIGGNSLGLLGTICSSRATSIPMLIGVNTFIGLAAAVQLNFAIVISELVPNKYRGYAVSALFCASAPVACFGPVIARCFILYTRSGWRWSYYINIICTSIAVGLFYLFYHPPTYAMLHVRHHSKRSILKMLDIVGIVLFAGGLVCFLLGVSWGGQTYPWVSGQVIGTIIGGAFILVGFVFWEIYGAGEYPLVPMRLFKNRHYISIVICASVGACVYYGFNIIWPTQIEVLYTQDILLGGWLSCTVGSGSLLGQIIGGLVLRRVGKHKLVIILAMICLTAFNGAMAGTDVNTRALGIACTLLACTAEGFVENIGWVISPFCLAPEDLGLALGFLGSARCLLSTIAQTVYVSILTNKLTENVPKYVAPAAVKAGLPVSSLPSLFLGLTSGNFTDVVGITPTIIADVVSANQTAYMKSFQMVYVAAIGFGAIGLIAAFNCPTMEDSFNESISRKLHGKHIIVVEELEQIDA